MKKILLITSLILSIALLKSSNVFSQAPQGFNYQAVARDASGQSLVNKSVMFRISLLQGSISGTAVYAETQATTTNQFGLITLNIGSGTVVSGTFASINWAGGPYFIKVEMDAAGGTSFQSMGTSQLLSVPYAQYAVKAGNGFSGSYNDLNGKPDFSKWDKDSTDNVTIAGYQNITGGKTFSEMIYANSGINLNNKTISSVANPVYNADAVNKAYLEAKIEVLEKRLNTQDAGGTVKDYDANIYNTVKIGNQIWMTENLKTAHYNNGDPIATTTPDTLDISLFATPKYQWPYKGNESNVSTYGRLYTYYAITDARGVCPVGWHVPTDPEWTTLEDYLGGIANAGGKMKEQGTAHWTYANGDDNPSGFFALPAGYKGNAGNFYGLGTYAYFWSSTAPFTTSAYYRQVAAYFTSNMRIWIPMYNGSSVRCLKN
jgi:uncharacterized protein (TIGR02145 family)